MRSSLKVFSLFAVALLAVAPAGVTAQDDVSPERLFQRCKNAVQSKTEGCVRHINVHSEECAQLIRRLLAEGQVERARAVAHRCLNGIEVTSNSCQRSIRRICEECIRRLLRLEAEELARRLGKICEESLAAIERAEARAKHRIRSLF